MLLFRAVKAESTRLWWLSFLTCCTLMISPVANVFADETADPTGEGDVIVLVMVPEEPVPQDVVESEPVVPEPESETLAESGEVVAGEGGSEAIEGEPIVPPDPVEETASNDVSEPVDVPAEDAAPEAAEGAPSDVVEPVDVPAEDAAPVAGEVVPVDAVEPVDVPVEETDVAAEEVAPADAVEPENVLVEEGAADEATETSDLPLDDTDQAATDISSESADSPSVPEGQDEQASSDTKLLKTAETAKPATSLTLMTAKEAGLDDGTVNSIAAASEADNVSVLATGLVPTQDTPQNVVGVLVGSGVTFSNVTYTGAASAIGKFTGGTGIIGFEEGIIMGSGSIMDVVGPNDQGGKTTSHGLDGDEDLSALANGGTRDASVLSFDFVPAGNQIVFSYVFSSEEYNEYVGSQYNDVFAFYVNGQNCATVEGGAVSINTINNNDNSAQYVDNTDGHLNTQMDGLTVVLTCSATVNPGTTNTMKLAIADTGDTRLDSNVFIQAKSFSVPTPTPTEVPALTPTPSPTATPGATPAVTPTVQAGEPSKPQKYTETKPQPAPAVAAPVTGLPNTGSGQQSNANYALIIAFAMGAGISLVGVIRSSRGHAKS